MIDFIINGKAGGGKSKRAKKQIIQLLNERGVQYRFHFTQYKKHATEIAKKLCEEGATDVVAVGGDGTVHEVLNGLCNLEKVNFGIIPYGSGNDFVGSVNIPLNTKAALEIILNGKTHPTDFLVCDGIRGLNVIGTGIDVEILRRCYNSKLLFGKLKYFISLVISLIKFHFYDFKLKTDEGFVDKSALILCCGNGKKFGGGIPICPEAQTDDGKMDFVLVNRMKKVKIVSYLIKLMQGKILEQEFCDFCHQDEVEAVFDTHVGIEIDGEIYEDIDFKVHIEKGKLNLFRPD